MAKCAICAKRTHTGNTVSHSKRHTKRRFLPNLQKSRILLNGEYRSVTVCTRCLRNLHRVPRA